MRYKNCIIIQHLLSVLFTIKRALIRYKKQMKCIHKNVLSKRDFIGIYIYK